MSSTALIFMTCAWAFVIGLVTWAYWKLLSTPQDEQLPPPGSAP